MRRKIASPVTERESTAPMRWLAVCLKPAHGSSTSKPFTSIAAAAKFMETAHPGCTYEFIAANDRVDRSAATAWLPSHGFVSDELVGD